MEKPHNKLVSINYHPTKYWHALPQGRVQCDICPRACQLKEGQKGFCFVRECQGGQVVLTTYGRSSGFCVDPIEKKPLNHFLPGSAVLSFGTAGCNLGCLFCQNWDMSKSRETATLSDEASPRAIAEAALKSNCQSVAFTYNDPVIFMEYAVDVAKSCHEAGVKTVAVTAGYMCEEPRREFYQHMDAANVDLKAFSEKFYKTQCMGHLAPVLDTLVYLKKETSVWFEITTLLIPGLNDSESEIEEMTAWLLQNLGPDVPLHFTAFHPDWKCTDRPPTSLATLQRAREIACKKGLHYVYVGNVPDDEGMNTQCAQCGKLLIGRRGYDLAGWNLGAEGCCKSCGKKLPGVFIAEPGTWGSKRRIIRLSES